MLPSKAGDLDTSRWDAAEDYQALRFRELVTAGLLCVHSLDLLG